MKCEDRAPAGARPSFRKCASVGGGAVPRMGALIVGEKSGQIGRCVGVSVSANDGVGTVVRLRMIGRTGIAVVHAGRQPGGGFVTRGLIEGDAGGVFLDVEGGFECRREHRLLVVGVIARPAVAEDLPAAGVSKSQCPARPLPYPHPDTTASRLSSTGFQ